MSPEDDATRGAGKPVGERFSLVYGKRGPPLLDSARMRARLAGFLLRTATIPHGQIADEIYLRLGTAVRNRGPYYDSSRHWDEYLEEATLHDVLDTITLVWRVIAKIQSVKNAGPWREFVNSVFREENVGYRVDEKCGVHFDVDPQFRADAAAAIASLDNERYSRARNLFQSALARFDDVPPKGKDAIRDAFEAAETLAKIILGEGRISRLDSTAVEKHLKPFAATKLAGNGPAIDAANLALNSLSHWVAAAHQYRHGQDGNDPIEPPLELAVYLVSLGAAHLRWLATLGD